MTTHRPNRFLLPAALLLVLGSLNFACGGEATSAASRPNIVFLMADDLGYGELGCYGQTQIRTPRVDQLAAEGIRFTQAYAGSSVCAASRCSLMTGMHNGHNRVRDNIPHYVDYLQDADVTIAEVLRDAGYRCGGIGKWSLGNAGTSGCATNQGFDTFLGYLDQDHAHYYFTDYLDRGAGRLELPDNPTTREHYSHDLLTDEALTFIRQSKDQPFFFYGAYALSHYGHRSESPTRFPIPSDAPYSRGDWDQASKNYAAMITLLDHDVGRIINLIDELGLAEETLVIFTSDNGVYGGAPDRFQSSGPLRGTKRDMYEGGIRIPLVARWPGKIPSGLVSDEILTFWDMLPTFAELAGVDPPERIDGKTALDALLGEKRATPHEHLYWDYGHCRAKFAQAVRLGDFKGVRTSLSSPVELYDLSSDLGESHDISDTHPQQVRRIEALMESSLVESDHYPIGEPYRGQSQWVREHTRN